MMASADLNSDVILERPPFVDEAVPIALDDSQAFYHAAVEGDLSAMETLIHTEHVDINHIFTGPCIQPWHRGNGAIHTITRKGRLPLLRAVVSLGASVDLQNKSGDTALHIACKHGLTDCVDFLLKCDPDLKDAQNNQGLTPLVKAVFRFENAFKSSYMKTIRRMMEEKVNVNLSPSSGISPLHIAAGKGDGDLLKELLNGGAKVNAICTKGFSPLLTALCRTRIHTESIKLLLDAGAEVCVCTVAGRTALHLAVSKSDDRAVQHLLDAGADPNYEDNYHKTPLWIAVHENNIKIVPLLINYGGNVNHVILPSKMALLSMAIQKQFEKMAQLLIQHGANVNSESALGSTPLHMAVEVQSIAMVKLLLNENCLMDKASNSRHILCPQTPLQLAFEMGNLLIIQLLMQAGCKVKDVWLRQQNLPLTLTSQPNVLAWIIDYHFSPKTLSHLSCLKCRKLLRYGMKKKLDVLIQNRFIPHRLGLDIQLKDLLKR